MMSILGLLRSDVRRLIHGRKLWVMHALMLACAAFVLFAAWLEANGGEMQVDSYVGESSISPNVTYATHGDMFARLGFSGVWMSMTTVLAVLIAIEDFDTGFAKNLFAGCSGRGGRIGYVAEKLMLLALLTVWFVVVPLAVLEIGAPLVGVTVTGNDDWGLTLGYVALMTLGIYALVAIAATVTWVCRNKAASVVVALLMMTGTFSSLLLMLNGQFASKVSFIRELSQSTAYYSLMAIDSPSALMRIPDLNETAGGTVNALVPTWGWPLWAFALVHFVVWIVVGGAVSLVAVRKRDIR